MTSRAVAVVLTVIFGLVLQATVFAALNPFGLGIVPDFALIVAVSLGLLKGPWYGAVIGLATGLFCDLLSGGAIVGVGALAKMVAGFAAGLLEKTIFKDNLFVPFLSLLAGTLLSEIIFLVISGALGMHVGPVLLILPRLLALALYNAVLAPLVYHQFYRLENAG